MPNISMYRALHPVFTAVLRALALCSPLVAHAAPFSDAAAPAPLVYVSPATATLANPADYLAGASSSSPETQQAAATASPAPVLDQSFFHRLGRAYTADWAGNGPATAVAQQERRGTPAPLFSPPYPASDWPIGGTPVIGAPDGQTYPLMQALDENKSVHKIYGWIEVGANGSTNNKTNAGKGIASNAPAAYDVYANTIQLDQAALYFEKIENTAQKAHFDWGYRLTLLYGTDYRFTTSHGLLSQQLLVKNAQYGFDPVMFYVDGYFPDVGKGMVLRVGRYISLPDIEAQLAPNNYTYSHSILYTYDCYTQLGANATIKVSDHWTVQAGISAGCDTMPWTTDAKVTGNFCATYTWSNGGNAVNTCANSINDAKYAYNNLAALLRDVVPPGQRFLAHRHGVLVSVHEGRAEHVLVQQRRGLRQHSRHALPRDDRRRCQPQLRGCLPGPAPARRTAVRALLRTRVRHGQLCRAQLLA